MRFCHIGKGNVVNAAEVECVLYPNTLGVKRRIKDAEANGTLILANRGRAVRSVIVMKSGRLILSLLSYETLMNRLNGKTPEKKAPEEEEEGYEEDDDAE